MEGGGAKVLKHPVDLSNEILYRNVMLQRFMMQLRTALDPIPPPILHSLAVVIEAILIQ